MIEYKVESLEQADVLILPFFKDNLDIERFDFLSDSTADQVKKVLDSQDFEAEKMSSSLVYTSEDSLSRVYLLGVGDKEDFNIRNWKNSIGSAIKNLQEKELSDISVCLPKKLLQEFSARKASQETVAAIETANYAFDKYKDEEDKTKPIESVTFVDEFKTKQKENIVKGALEGQKVSIGVNLTRDLGNTSPSEMTPTMLADTAEKIGKETDVMEVGVMSQSEIEELGMGCFLGVAKGSDMAPKFIKMEYNGGGDEDPTVIVGKGITFDSGGLSLKPSKHMTDMKYDMLGAGTALGVMQAIAKLGLGQNIVCLIASCENMPGSKAYRPDDVLEAMDGTTVEIGNTDAEGRLTMADALSYTKENYEPKEIIDFATLTGACMVALGKERSGLFSPSDNMADKFYDSAQKVGENLWRLPLGEEYTESMKGEVADLRNLSKSKFGGASTAAAFLQNFVETENWTHIDLSSSYYGDKGKPWARYGANGFGVQATIEYLRN